MKRFARRVMCMPLCLIALLAAYELLRLNNRWIRPAYTPGTIRVNPAGTYALTEYDFAGGRFSELDPYRLFIGAHGDAFYTVTHLATGRLLRDSLADPGAIEAVSLGRDGNVQMDFRWNADGSRAIFPESLGPFHEWTGLEACRGAKMRTPYADHLCFSDDHSATCEALRRML